MLVETPQKCLFHFTFCPCRGLDHCGGPRDLCCGHSHGRDLRCPRDLCCGHLNQRTQHCPGIVTRRKAIATIPTPGIFIVVVDITDLAQLFL